MCAFRYPATSSGSSTACAFVGSCAPPLRLSSPITSTTTAATATTASTRQVPTAQVIHRCRELGMPVREVGRLVAVDDPDARAAVIGWHLARLEVRRTRSAATTVAAVRDVLDLADVLAWYDHAMGEIGDALVRVGAVPSGPPGGLYDNALFTDERGEALVYVPVATRPPTARLLRTSSPPLRWRRPCTPAPPRRHRRHLRNARQLPEQPRTAGRRAGPRDLPRRPPRHRRQLVVAHRDRLADLSGRPGPLSAAPLTAVIVGSARFRSGLAAFQPELAITGVRRPAWTGEP